MALQPHIEPWYPLHVWRSRATVTGEGEYPNHGTAATTDRNRPRQPGSKRVERPSIGHIVPRKVTIHSFHRTPPAENRVHRETTARHHGRVHALRRRADQARTSRPRDPHHLPRPGRSRHRVHPGQTRPRSPASTRSPSSSPPPDDSSTDHVRQTPRKPITADATNSPTPLRPERSPT